MIRLASGTCLLPLGLALVLGSSAPADAQVVQLPTFSSFSVGTTVVVPDRGSVYLGGVTRAREGNAGLGRGFGREFSRRDAVVSATIIDLHELDQEVLASARRIRAARQAKLSPAERIRLAEQAAAERKAAWITRHLGRGQRR